VRARTDAAGGAELEGAVVIAASPAVDEDWAWLEGVVAAGGGRTRCVVCNGRCSNGLEWLEPVFYVKPCTGWGVVLREYPRGFEVVSARTGAVLDVDVKILQQGRVRRPDLRTCSSALMKDFYA
jgi:hypothetical protein